MTGTTPAGWHTVTARIVVEDPPGLVEFLKSVFEATAEVRVDSPSQIMIGDSILMVSRVGPRENFPAFLYVYVEDADATFQRAIDAGAVSLEAEWKTPYGDRRGMVNHPGSDHSGQRDTALSANRPRDRAAPCGNAAVSGRPGSERVFGRRLTGRDGPAVGASVPALARDGGKLLRMSRYVEPTGLAAFGISPVCRSANL
jgi:PhnB protein